MASVHSDFINISRESRGSSDSPPLAALARRHCKDNNCGSCLLSTSVVLGTG